jgi:cell division protein FtsQ
MWRRWRAAFLCMFVLAILAGAGWAILGSSLLAVRNVQVVGANRLVPAAQVRSMAAIRLGTPLARVDTGATADRVERITDVLWARVTRSWPHTIVITIRERTAALAVATGAGYRLIDGSGVTVRVVRRKPAALPLLSSAPAVLRGSPAIRAAVAILGRLPRGLRSEVVSVSAPSAGAVTLRLHGGVTVVWGSPGNVKQKVAELVLLMRTHARYYDVSASGTAVTQG